MGNQGIKQRQNREYCRNVENGSGKEGNKCGMRGIEIGMVYFPKFFQSSYFYYTTKLHLLTSWSDSW